MKHHLLIVDGQFYTDISAELLRGADAELKKQGFSYDHMPVPGAFEIPGAIRMAMESGKYNGYIALGCVLRGETTHYDYVCSESARGLMDLVTQHAIALGYGILTCETEEQAWERAGVDKGNKGGAVAQACIRMVQLREQFGVK